MAESHVTRGIGLDINLNSINHGLHSECEFVIKNLDKLNINEKHNNNNYSNTDNDIEMKNKNYDDNGCNNSENENLKFTKKIYYACLLCCRSIIF